MAEEDEWKKLPPDQKVQHSSWKARAEGYKECIKNFARYDSKSPEFSKYLGLLKKFVTDSNELNRIQGLQATLVYVENAHCAGKTCSEVLSGVITKCFNAKPKLREMGIEVANMYIEIDKNELVVEEILKGLENKQPKIVNACLETLIKALSEFGSKVVSIKPIIKQSIKLLDHRDKNVRESAKYLFIEIYRWIGAAVQVPLQGINPVVLKELSDEWEKVGTSGKKQTRFMRSQQDLKEKMEAKSAASSSGGVGDSQQEEEETVDPFDLLEPQDILSKLPKNFYDQIEEKKWQERKLALEECEKLATLPKLMPGDYADLVKALKKVLSKDTNIMLVAISIKCIGGLAKGLRKKFHPYALVCLEGMLERFKEKKITVVTALQEAVDAIYLTTNIQAIVETCVEALTSKNPSIRAHTGFFLSRAILKTKASTINKATMKQFLEPLLKNMDHSTPDVRESSFQAVGALMKVVGENKVQPFIVDLDKLKTDKINDAASKLSGGDDAKAAEPATKPPAAASTSKRPTTSGQTGAGKKTKPAGDATKSGSGEASSKVVKGGGKKAAASSKSKPAEPAVEAELSDEAAEEAVLNVITPEEKTQILNNNWKERLAGLQSVSQKLKMLDRKSLPCQAFAKFLSIKPGLKDNNFNCLNEKFSILRHLAENGSFSRTSASVCLNATCDKVGDVKCGVAAKAFLTAIGEAAGYPWTVEQVITYTMSQKNPKIQSESLIWLADSVREFGVSGLNVKLVIEKVKLALAATNPAVRTSGLGVIGSLALFLGNKIRMLFENEKPALLQLIDAEMEKVKGQSPPAPTRGVKSSKTDEANDDNADDEEEPEVNFDDMVTRVNISGKITDALVNQIADKNWKERKQGLEAVVAILDEVRFVEANLGDLPSSLKARLSDSNKLLVTTTVNIFAQLGTALGPHCGKHLQTFLSNLIAILADSKPLVRQATLKCMDIWLSNTKLSAWLEGETMSSALAVAKHTFLRIELLNWLAEKLTACTKLSAAAREGMELCLPVLYSCCEDRSGDVRAKAQACLPVFMRHLGYDKMLRATSKLGASSKGVILALLDKSRDQMPPPPQGAKKQGKTEKSAPPAAAAPPAEESKAPETTNSKQTKEKRGASKRQPSVSKKPPPEEDKSPLFLSLPNGKEQRAKDELKLKTIKWHFNTPREELITQLQQQLVTCVSPATITEMFHADFLRHLKAIATLNEAITSDMDSTVSNLDVLLRWITLRFYDKNTTVHIKSLEYLKSLFEALIERNYKASEYEMSAFLPHLITKIGENKDNIRKGVHGILKQISYVYPSSKLFNYLMDGVKSKNSRQRSECLDHVALLIERNGLVVCQPTPGKALKEIASNISDRDKVVRSSALNAIVAAYNVSGDVVFKQVGKLNEKDMSMLEERIKRSGKFGVSATANTEQPPPPPPAASVVKEAPQQKLHSPPRQAQAGHADNASARNNSVSSKVEPKPQNEEEFIEDPAEIPEIKKILSRIKPVEWGNLLEPIPLPDCIKEFNQANATNIASSALDVIISQIASPLISTSITANQELWEITNHKDKLPLLAGKMEELVNASCTQLRLISNKYLPLVVSAESHAKSDDDTDVTEEAFLSLCKTNFAVLLNIFSVPELAQKPSPYVLSDLLRYFIQLLVSDNLPLLTSTRAAKLTQSLNMLVLRMLKNCDPTSIFCALVRLLHDSMDTGSDVFIDIVVKCLWKTARAIPNLLKRKADDDGTTQPTLNVAAVMSEIDRFWRTYPRSHPAYSRIRNEVPLRTVKTLVVTLCKEMGDKVADCLYLITQPDSSQVISTVEKYTDLSAAQIRERIAASSERKENISTLFGESLEAKLSAIFKKVVRYSETEKGLRELYDFQQEFPSYDVNKHVESLGKYRDYVKRGLAKIHYDKTGEKIEAPGWTIDNLREQLNALKKVPWVKPVDKNKLRAELEEELGLNEKQPPGGATQSKVLAPSTSLNQISGGPSSSSSSNSLSDAQERPRANAPSSLSDLKRRLELIKQRSTSAR